MDHSFLILDFLPFLLKKKEKLLVISKRKIVVDSTHCFGKRQTSWQSRCLDSEIATQWMPAATTSREACVERMRTLKEHGAWISFMKECMKENSGWRLKKL